MNPTHYTNLARRIGADCRYEFDKTRGQFRWQFYVNGQVKASVKRPNLVITTAEKFALDKGKLFT